MSVDYPLEKQWKDLGGIRKVGSGWTNHSQSIVSEMFVLNVARKSCTSSSTCLVLLIELYLLFSDFD